MKQYDVTPSSKVITAPEEHSEATTDVTVFDEKQRDLEAKAAYQVYAQADLAKESEGNQLLADRGGHILRRMLCSQLIAAHDTVLAFLQRGGGQDNTVEAARLVNAASRLMTVFQQGVLALHNLQAGNEQRITLQQVNVSGGNAVVAANLRTGAPAPLGPAEEY